MQFQGYRGEASAARGVSTIPASASRFSASAMDLSSSLIRSSALERAREAYLGGGAKGHDSASVFQSQRAVEWLYAATG